MNPRLLARGLLIVLTLRVSATFAALPPEEIVPPPLPSVPPLIGNTYPHDADQDRVADNLAQRVVTLDVQQLVAFVPDERDAVQQELDQFVDVELIFNQQITQAQLDAFTGLGGEISYIYKAVSYGWNGRVPLGIATALPSIMGPSLMLVQEPLQAQLHMDTATRTGRVRPIWASGFAG